MQNIGSLHTDTFLANIMHILNAMASTFFENVPEKTHLAFSLSFHSKKYRK